MHSGEEDAFNSKGKQMKQLLSSCAALALIAFSANAQAEGRNGAGTIALSLGLGFGQVYADTYGSKANANTKNTYTSSAKASITPPAEEPVECLSACEESTVMNGKKHPVVSTEAHATATNESSTNVQGYADATARGFSLGAGWGAILWPHGKSGTAARSGAIAGGLSGSYSSSQGHASASGTGVGNATADATNGTEGQSSSSSASGGATASASSSGKGGYASNTSGGASVGIGASY
jgi:hypothetical protein